MKHTALIMMTSFMLLLSVSSVHAFGEHQGVSEWQRDSRLDSNIRQGFSHREFSQNQNDRLVPRSEVMKRVKREYNAEVLKITLNSDRTIYRVRVLMPNGKVRVLRINARR